MPLKKLIYTLYDLFTFNQRKYLAYFQQTDLLDIEETQDLQLGKIAECCRIHYGIHLKSWIEFYRLKITTKEDLPLIPPDAKNLKFHETSGSTG